jgi:alkyl hydroperoxide reductase subunit AhpF
LPIESEQTKVRELLVSMTSPVRLVFFYQSFLCETCPSTRQILTELSRLSEQLTFEEYNLQLDREKVEEFGVDKVPAVVVVGTRGNGLCFYGIPSGYEFSSIVDAILLESNGDSGLSTDSRTVVANVTVPTNIQVFVAPT